MYFNNGLYNLYLWEDIKDYAKLYFIYTTQSSLLISNYAIRTDDYMEDIGNFPLWNNDLFEKYNTLAKKDKNLIIGGRLAEYKYYDMDKVIVSAIEAVRREIN